MALPTEIRPDTLELILGLTKDVPERQLQDVTALDGKMMQLFSVGGVVIGLAGLSTITAATTSSGPVGPALLFGLLCFAALATVALLELTVRTYRRTPNGADLWSTHYLREANDVRHAL
ncbi:MAG: hypothetical protein HY329_22225, partial [Chloroflexi bacterium]|nr:hypothetical protein [Chloroflexota bacterium]